MLADDVAAREAIAQHVLDGLGDPLHPFACTKDIDPANLRQVIHFVAGLGGPRRLKVTVADDQLPVFHPEQLPGVLVRVSGLQTRFENLKECLSASNIAV